MEVNNKKSLEYLEERLTDIVELYKEGKIDDIQFWVLKNFEFDTAQCLREEEIKAAYVSGTGHDNWDSFHNKPKEMNEAYKNAETYYKENFKNK
jgi:hypothetical protein